MSREYLEKLLLDLDSRMSRVENTLYGTDPEAMPSMVAPDEPVKKVKKSRKTKQAVFDLGRIDDMSHTELVQACRDLGHAEASRQLLREDLIEILVGGEMAVEDPLESVRREIHSFVQGNKTLLEAPLKCDRNCPVCPHDMVVECYTDNNDKIGELE
jgi:hypothetical protein